MKVRKALKASVTRCGVVSELSYQRFDDSPVFGRNDNKNSTKVICFDCQIKELVCYG